MVIIKNLLIGILLIFPAFIKGQDLSIEFSYLKQSNSIILKLYNPTDKDVRVMNQGILNETTGSFIILTQRTSKGEHDALTSLFDLENGKRVHAKIIPPKGKLEMCYPFDYIPVRNVIKARLFLSIYFVENKIEKLTPKLYYKEITLGSPTTNTPSDPWYNSN